MPEGDATAEEQLELLGCVTTLEHVASVRISSIVNGMTVNAFVRVSRGAGLPSHTLTEACTVNLFVAHPSGMPRTRTQHR